MATVALVVEINRLVVFEAVDELDVVIKIELVSAVVELEVPEVEVFVVLEETQDALNNNFK